MNHPIKRFKADDFERNRVNKILKYDLYAGQNNSEASVLPNYVQQGQNFSEDIKNEMWRSEVRNPNGSKSSKSESESDKNSNKTRLLTNEGLQPSYADLNKIFDNSDDNSNDDPVRN